MNLGRFHAAIHVLRQEFEQDNLVKVLANLQSTLQGSISQPDPQTALAFKDSYATLVTTLQNAKSIRAYPTRQKIFEEIGAAGYIGLGLANRIATIFSENQITPANALTELQALAKQANQFFQRVKVIDDAFTELKLERDELEPGQFEIGLSLPKLVTGSDIGSLENEFHEIDFVLKTLQEVVGAGAGSLSVKTISASEWQIYLEAVPTLAAGLAFAIERIVTLYKNNLEIKKLKKELEERKLPENVLKPLQDHIETTVKNEIRKIAEELVEQYYKNDDQGRKNELKNQTSQALRYLADRIDRGATIEVHAEPPEKPTDERAAEDKDSAKKYIEVRELANFVNEKMVTTAQLARSDQPILAIEYDKNNKR